MIRNGELDQCVRAGSHRDHARADAEHAQGRKDVRRAQPEEREQNGEQIDDTARDEAEISSIHRNSMFTKPVEQSIKNGAAGIEQPAC